MPPGALTRAQRELLLRLASAAVLMPVAIAATLAATWSYAALAAVALTVAAWEWCRLTGLGPVRIALLVLPSVVTGVMLAQGLGPAAVAALALTLAAAVGARDHWPWALAGGLYLSLPILAGLWLITAGGDGALVVLWLLAVVWATDVFAYAAGRLIGGPRLAPRLSPGKTWAGLAGGVAGASAVAAVFAVATGVGAPLVLAFDAAFLAVIAQAGDLLESALKRRFGAKDAGRLIPGHGGMLDRIDGLMTAAPALALLVALTGGAGGPPGWR